jgi:hypothetical protein
MASERRSAHLDPVAHERLTALRRELREQGVPGEPTNPALLSALVMYTTAPQLAGMLAEYTRYTARRERESKAAAEASDEQEP